MLNIYFGDMEEAIYNPAVYFKNTYQDSWITNERSKAMIKDVDKSTVIAQESLKVRCWEQLPKRTIGWCENAYIDRSGAE